MSRPSHPESFQARFLDSVGLSRALLFGVGGGLILLALLAALVPTRFFGSIVRFVGLLLLGSATLKASQFLFRRLSPAQERRGFLFIAAQVALDAGLGLLLLNHRELSVGVLALLFGMLVLAEGLILGGMALKAPVVRSRLLLAATAAIIGGVGLAVLFRQVDPIRWAGALVGLKLFLFGLTLVSIAAFSPG